MVKDDFPKFDLNKFNPLIGDDDIQRDSDQVLVGDELVDAPDGVGDTCGNCPAVPNSDQLDSDQDGVGNANSGDGCSATCELGDSRL